MATLFQGARLQSLKRIYRQLRRELDRRRVIRAIRWLHGPKSFAPSRHNAVVVALVKDAEDHILEFIHYYMSLGVANIILIDNGSTDATIAIARRFDCVSIFTTDLDFLSNESALRRHFLNTYLKGCWVICVDADEHFHFPYQANSNLQTLLQHLNNRNFNCVTACMLDMYGDGKSDLVGQSFSDRYPYCEIASIQTEDYPTDSYHTRGNTLPFRAKSFKGGVRTRLMQGQRLFLLIKHPLLFIDQTIEPFSHPHFAANARIADFNCVLLHYKFTKGFVERIQSTLTSLSGNSYWAGENRAYLEHLRDSHGSFFETGLSIRFSSVEDLAAAGLLMAGDDLAFSLTRAGEPHRAHAQAAS